MLIQLLILEELQEFNEVEINENHGNNDDCENTDFINEVEDAEESIETGGDQQDGGHEEEQSEQKPEQDNNNKSSDEPSTSKADIKISQKNRFKASSMKITSFSHSFFGKSRDSDKLGDNKKINKDLEKNDREVQSKFDLFKKSCDLDDSAEILKVSQDSLELLEDGNEKKDAETSEHETESSESEDNVQMDEEAVKKQLLRVDPHYDVSRVIFSYRHSSYKPLLRSPTEIFIYELIGSIAYVELEENQEKDDQLESSEAEGEAAKGDLEEVDGENHAEQHADVDNDDRDVQNGDDGEDVDSNSDVDEMGQGEAEDGNAEEGEPERELAEEEAMDELTGTERKKLTNQFNYSERGAMTYRAVYRAETCQTEPPPSDELNDLVCQYAIWDSYQEDYSVIERAKEKEKQAKILFLGIKKYDGWKRKPSSPKALIQKRLNEATRILERMVNQNTYHELAHDYQFYDDPADKYKHEGSLLPLWEFQYESTYGFTVTDLIWNPQHKDMFGATFGSFSFLEPVKYGYLVLYTLKNPTYPEFVANFNCGAMSLDFHPKHSKYVAVGLHDGTVRVFNLSKRKMKRQVSINSPIHNKHIGHVWKVIWVDDHRDKQLGFFSAGSDGRIFKWILLKTDLMQSPVITLSMDDREVLMGHVIHPLKVCCTCVTFNPKDFEIFFVGSAEGLVYKCSISYASNYLFVYHAHKMPIYQISINTFIPSIFLTSSEDWRIKIWEDCRKEPLFIFDLECSIHDIQWAPYSSTVFAAATADGNVQVFDLNVNKHNPICVQMVIANQQNSHLTRLKFNTWIHIILVGDTRGIIQTFKVSPNLRLQVQLPKKAAYVAPRHLEIKKLEKILSFVREPMDLKPLFDMRSTRDHDLGLN